MKTQCPFKDSPCNPECKLFSIPKEEGLPGECKIVETLNGLSEIGEKLSSGGGGILGTLLGMGGKK